MENSPVEDPQADEVLEASRRLIRSAGIDPEPLNLRIQAEADGLLLTFDPHPLDIRADLGMVATVSLDQEAVELILQAEKYVPMQLIEQYGDTKVWVGGKGMPTELTPEIENLLRLQGRAGQSPGLSALR